LGRKGAREPARIIQKIIFSLVALYTVFF